MGRMRYLRYLEKAFLNQLLAHFERSLTIVDPGFEAEQCLIFTIPKNGLCPLKSN